MIIRNINELSPDRNQQVFFLGVLYIHIVREKNVIEHSFNCLAESEHSAKQKLNSELLKWMKDKLEKYCNQREEAFTHSNGKLNGDQINALYHIRSVVLKKQSLLEFSQSLGFYWNYIALFMPEANSRQANWRSVIKQIWYTCQREAAHQNSLITQQ